MVHQTDGKIGMSTGPSASARARRGRNVARMRAAPSVFAPSGGRLTLLGPGEAGRIHAAALTLLSEPGLSEAPPAVTDLVLAAGGGVTPDGRLTFPRATVEEALAGLRRDFTLHGRRPGCDLSMALGRVHVGTGGAAPLIVDIETGRYRASTLADLYDAARLTDRLDHIHFFSRPLVAGDMNTPEALDINTAFAALAGTAKHVMTSVACASHLDSIVDMCHRIAGSSEAFAARPFLSINVNHVAPPMRFSQDAANVLVEAARADLPVMVNTFGQTGASSPAAVAGSVAQTHAETLAGMVVAWLANPNVRAIYGARPMMTDLRTGAMAGGSGEQARATAVATELARHCGLPSSTIAGATDSKVPDAQAGYEKALNIAMAVHSGANLVTQAAGMQAGLMGICLEGYVIDNDMLGAILRSAAPVEVDPATLSPQSIAEVVRGDGHFLGHADTLARMETDFLYPELADRSSPEEWEARGAPGLRDRACERARDILASHFPDCIPASLRAELRHDFDIRLSGEGMGQG